MTYVVEMSDMSSQKELPDGWHWRSHTPARAGDTVEYFCCKEHPRRQVVVTDEESIPRSEPHRIV